MLIGAVKLGDKIQSNVTEEFMSMSYVTSITKVIDLKKL
jgi:hypothetical protein